MGSEFGGGVGKNSRGEFTPGLERIGDVLDVKGNPKKVGGKQTKGFPIIGGHFGHRNEKRMEEREEQMMGVGGGPKFGCVEWWRPQRG